MHKFLSNSMQPVPEDDGFLPVVALGFNAIRALHLNEPIGAQFSQSYLGCPLDRSDQGLLPHRYKT
ncbi:hypothetical protein M378DRAFT_645200 [Amanita muscaria Koide BX008]|uniref:Uncharacterized protein n=1 Tax=Amanita muscaria (strain Koide BX008) TaxID=946122 RepID=A0A0C2SMP7_AMAMK|nr:hypothetical protein M378DRAFT_645200 [Amanita muscaria Koide BX008]